MGQALLRRAERRALLVDAEITRQSNETAPCRTRPRTSEKPPVTPSRALKSARTATTHSPRTGPAMYQAS